MLNGYHNKNGENSVELVAYIYGELDESRRNDFESHLTGCDECAIELAAMSDARLGVVEWRRTDFEHLATPEIVIPVDRPVTTRVVEQQKAPLFAGLVESLFSFPVFARAGVGLAAVALIVGAIYFASTRSSTSDQLAGNPTEAVQPQSVVGSEPNQVDMPKDPVTADKVNGRIAPPMKNDPEPLSTKRQLASAEVKKNATAPKNNRKSGSMPSNSAIARTKAPRLNNFDDDEDKTLRLVDLFAEVGPSKK